MDKTTPEENEVIAHEDARQVSQSSLERSTIDEVGQKLKRTYPLDARNLEISSRFLKLKKRRLGASDKGPSKRPRPPPSSSAMGDDVSMSEFRLSQEDDSAVFKCPSELWNKLYGFQRTGVQFLLSKFMLNTGGLLADEMGLGKSIQVIGFLCSLIATFGVPEHPMLIICPSTLIAHWEDEARKWSCGLLTVVRCADSSALTTGALVSSCLYVISYEMFRVQKIRGEAWSVVVLDEAQRIRNPDSKTTISVKQLNCYCRIALSGSPIQNNLSELWSIFDFVAPGRLGTLPTFQEELAIPIETGTKPRASLNQVEVSHRCAIIVRDLTAPLMLRRLKADFSSELELADKEEQVLFCQLTPDQIELYCKFLSTETVRQAASSGSKNLGKTFYAISILRKICNHPDLLLSEYTDIDDYGNASRSGKLCVLIPLLELWKREEKRCLIFSQSLGMLDILQQTLRLLGISFARMDGSTPMASRAGIVDLFDSSKGSDERDGPMCLLLSTRVGGVGLNLTCAERVVIFDPDWNPMTDAQARERSWRIGQKKRVKIFRLIAADSIEEVICKRQIFKHYLAQKILTDPRQSKVSDWDSLFDIFKPPKRVSESDTKANKTTRKLLDMIDRGAIQGEEEEKQTTGLEGGDPLQSLITKVWNQEEIEMPKLNSALLDSSQTEMAVSRAVEALLADTTDQDITVPTWTGKSGGSLLTAKERSRSLVDQLSSVTRKTTTYESEQLVVEKAVVRELMAYFRKKRDFRASTGELLSAFSAKINAGHSEIFRSCLRQLCSFDSGAWILHRDHR